MIIRHPRPDEVDTILALFEDEVRAGRMLPRARESVSAALDDWLVAEAYNEVVGCVSLVHFNPALSEIRSLAVRPDYRGNGLAVRLVEAALELARAQDVRQLLALTRAPRVFERAGFRRDYVNNFPEKVWRDCTPCPFRHACDEITLTFDLSAEVVYDRP